MRTTVQPLQQVDPSGRFMPISSCIIGTPDIAVEGTPEARRRLTTGIESHHEKAEEEIQLARRQKFLKADGLDTVLLLCIPREDTVLELAKGFITEYITTVHKMYKLYGVKENIALVIVGEEAEVCEHLNCEYDRILMHFDDVVTKILCGPSYYSKYIEGHVMALSAIVGRGKIHLMNGYKLYPRIIVIAENSYWLHELQTIDRLNITRNFKNIPKYFIDLRNEKPYMYSKYFKKVAPTDVQRLARHFKNLVAYSKTLQRQTQQIQSTKQLTDRKDVPLRIGSVNPISKKEEEALLVLTQTEVDITAADMMDLIYHLNDWSRWKNLEHATEKVVERVREPRQIRSCICSASMEIGPSSCGYTVSNMIEDEINHRKPTRLLLTPNKLFYPFAQESAYKFLRLLPQHNMKYYHFDFNKTCGGSFFYDDNDKPIPAKTIFQHIIQSLMDEIKKVMLPTLFWHRDTSDIWYAITISAAWSDKKDCIAEAAKEAGLRDDQFVVITETDALSSDLQHILRSLNVSLLPEDEAHNSVITVNVDSDSANISVFQIKAEESIKSTESPIPHFVCRRSIDFENNFLDKISEILHAIKELWTMEAFKDQSIILLAGDIWKCKAIKISICKRFLQKQIHVYLSDKQQRDVGRGAIHIINDKFGQQMINCSLKKKDVHSALAIACRNEDIMSVREILQKQTGNVSSEILGFALDVAFRFKQDEVIRELLKAKVDKNHTVTDMDIFYGLEDIALAIEKRDKSEVDRLVSKVFTSDLRKLCWNILYIAASKGTADMCEYLIQQGFTTDVDVMQKAVTQVVSCNDRHVISQLSPLSVAVHFKKTENIKVLAKYSNESVLEKCDNISPEIEPLVLNEIRERLTTKYETLKPRVIAGHLNGSATLVVYSDVLLAPKTETYCGREVIIKNQKIFERQNSAMLGKTQPITEENTKIACNIINDNGKFLWQSHTNLNVISMSPINHTHSKENESDYCTCILLLCTFKGFIPLGEKKFPTELSTLDKKHTLLVDVQDGYFELCPSYQTGASSLYHERLKMGCLIGKAGGSLNGGGTLGPFININGSPGFLTCAHVLFDIQKPLRYDATTASSQVDVVQPSADASTMVQPGNVLQDMANTPCGSVKRAIFEPKTSSGISVDAAAVTIDSRRAPEQGQFAFDQESYLARQGFDKYPLFNNGITRDPTDVKPWVIVVKFGSRTHLTSGRLVAQGTQVKPLFTNLGLPNSASVPLTNQIEVQDLDGTNAFFMPGDSGSAVFTRKEDGSLACIGMAIGRTSNNTTVVTPIAAILQELGPGITLQTFP